MHKRRRARNDPNNRDYQCPCGKSYLSYPALYTHIKQKHEGKVNIKKLLYKIILSINKIYFLNQAPGPVKRPNN